MNTNLKKLAKGGQGTNVLVNVLLAVVLVCCLLVLILTMGGTEEGPYTADSKEGSVAYIDAQYASEYFAEFEALEEYKLYFMLDAEYKAYIVCVSDSEIDAYSDLQAYTYGETTKVPEIVRVSGKLVAVDSTLIELAVESYNYFWGENVVTAATATEFFGAYYIDTAASTVSSEPIILIIIVLALAVLLVIRLKKSSGVSGVSKQTLAALESSGEAARVDEELKDPRTVNYKKIGVYLTENYLVSNKNGLVVVPLQTLSGLYGVATEKYFSLITRDGGERETEAVRTVSRDNRLLEELAELVTAVSVKASGLEYGTERVRVEGIVNISQIQGFFAQKQTASSLQVQHDLTNEDGTITSPNYGLGVVGALIGALIGGVLWVVVGKLGYIAGIVGYLIIYLSATGFKKGAKALTKGGAVLSVVISVVVLFVANYVLYALLLVEAFDGKMGMGEALSRLPSAMKEFELTGSFVKDLLIGYGLSLLAAFSTLRNMFAKKK